MLRSLAVIAFAAAAGLFLITTLRSCTRDTLAEAGQRTAELSRAIRSAEGALQGVFGGGVRIDNHGVVHMPRDIAELAVTEHEVSVTSSFTRARWFGWFPSTLVVTGNYRGKLGIDLEQVRGAFDRQAGVLELELPPAKLLSVEQTGLWRRHESRSWFTPIAPHEVVGLVNRNASEARQRLTGGAVLRAADRRVEERLRDALRAAGLDLHLEEPAG
jgi:hypothetical protein